MKALPHIAATVFGLGFITFGLNYFLKFMAVGGAHPEGSPAALFFAAIVPTGFLAFVKGLQVLGGLLVLLPKTRNYGLLILTPIVVNIVAVNILIIGGSAVLAPPVIALTLLNLYVLFCNRGKFSMLANA